MKTGRRKFFSKPLFILLFMLFFAVPSGKMKCNALEPASMISAAPHAIALAKMWTPHAVNALGSAGQGVVCMGQSFIDIFRLPLGALQATAGAPFGYFSSGCGNVVRGCVAPFKFVWHTALLPIRLLSLGAVR